MISQDPEFPPLETIKSFLESWYGILVSDIKFLPLGMDQNKAVYKAQSPNKKSYFIKVKRNHSQGYRSYHSNLFISKRD